MRMIQKTVRTFAAGMAVSALALAAGAQAQAAPDVTVKDDAPAAPAAPAPSGDLQQGDIIVTAQRRSENIQSVPITIQAFSGATLRNLGVNSAADIGKVATNVTVALPQGAGNQPAVTIRGIGLNANNSNNAGPNGMYVDEFYLSAPTSQGFAMFDLERVEVLKGPQGTLYGRNTSGGAINFVTKKPTDEFEGYADVIKSNFGTTQLSGAVGGPIADGVSARLAFVRNYSDGYFYNTYLNRHQNGADDYSIRGSLLLKPTGNLKILLTGHGSHVDRLPDTYPHYGTAVPGTENTGSPVICSVAQTFASQCVDLYSQPSDPRRYRVASMRDEHLKVTDIGATGRIDWSPGSIDFTSITGYNYNKRFLPEDSDSSAFRLLKINWGNDSREFTQELRAGQTADRYNWVAGLYYLREVLNQNQSVGLLLDFDRFFGAGAGDGTASQQVARNKQITDAYAAFGQGEYKLTDGLKIIVGGRYTSEKRSFRFNDLYRPQQGGMDSFPPFTQIVDSTRHLDNSAFSYRVGLNYTVRPRMMVYATLTTGFKGGDFNGGFLSPDPAQAAFQQAPVQPEKVKTYEIGLKSEFFGGKVTFNAAGFYNDYRDLQLFALVPTPIGPLNVAANAQKARTYGADLDLTLRPTRNLTLSAQVGLLNAKLTKFLAVADASVPDYSGNQLANSPKFTTFLLANYHLPLDDSHSLTFQANATYKSSQFLDATNDPYTAQAAYWTEDARVSFQVKNLEISGFIRNISNTYYFVSLFNSTSPFLYVNGVTGQPRTYGLETRVTF